MTYSRHYLPRLTQFIWKSLFRSISILICDYLATSPVDSILSETQTISWKWRWRIISNHWLPSYTASSYSSLTQNPYAAARPQCHHPPPYPRPPTPYARCHLPCLPQLTSNSPCCSLFTLICIYLATTPVDRLFKWDTDNFWNACQSGAKWPFWIIPSCMPGCIIPG